MADTAQQAGAVSPHRSGWDAPRGTQNLRASNRIASFLTISVVLFAITTVGFAFWITREHNRLAGSSSEQMIRGGMANVDETLKTVALDFAIWPDAVRALKDNDGRRHFVATCHCVFELLKVVPYG